MVVLMLRMKGVRGSLVDASPFLNGNLERLEVLSI